MEAGPLKLSYSKFIYYYFWNILWDVISNVLYNCCVIIFLLNDGEDMSIECYLVRVVEEWYSAFTFICQRIHLTRFIITEILHHFECRIPSEVVSVL